MSELFAAAFFRGDAEALAGVAALVSIFAILPAALLFIINQLYQNSQLREEKHRHVIERYQAFLEMCLAHPELRLEYGDSVPNNKLSEKQLYQRDVLFDLLTSIFERAYLTYARRISSNRRAQWGGWDDYIEIYLDRPDYREWWLRVMFEGDPAFLEQDEESALAINTSQYDVRFERYMFGKLRAYDWKSPTREQLHRRRKRVLAM